MCNVTVVPIMFSPINYSVKTKKAESISFIFKNSYRKFINIHEQCSVYNTSVYIYIYIYIYIYSAIIFYQFYKFHYI